MTQKTIRVAGAEVTVTVQAMPSKVGTVYVAGNDYGEPRMTLEAYRTESEAMEAEIHHLRTLLEN